MNIVAPTTADSSFHLIKSEYAERSITRALENDRINLRDAALIREFIFELQSSINISVGRTNKLVFSIVGWRRFIGPFDENTITDLYAGIARMKNGTSYRGTPFKQNTIADLVAILKQFYSWLLENDYTDIPEKKLRKLKTPSKDPMTKEAGDLLTPAEITALMNACQRSVDRALIMMLYEGGFRIGELGKMAWKDLVFDDHGVIVNVNFKTGKPRYIRLVMAREHLAKWRTDYPFIPEGNNLVFVTARRTPLTHGSIRKQLERIGRRAGINKHITPHLFRHSRITHLIKEGVSESVIKLMMWGTINSRMFHTYAHLTGQDIDREILNSYGIAFHQKSEDLRLEPRQCIHCSTINAPISNYCSSCGRPLTEEAESTLTDIKGDVSRHPDVLQELIERKIREMKAMGMV